MQKYCALATFRLRFSDRVADYEYNIGGGVNRRTARARTALSRCVTLYLGEQNVRASYIILLTALPNPSMLRHPGPK
jgi:hypothetical protein